MLKEETKKMLDEVDDLFNEYKDELFDLDNVSEIDPKGFIALCKCLKIYKQAKELSLKQAEAIDEINNKLDKLLAKKD